MIPGKVTLNEKVVQVSAGDSHTAALTEEGSVYIWGSFRVSELLVREQSGPVCCLSNYFYHPSITFYVIVFALCYFTMSSKVSKSFCLQHYIIIQNLNVVPKHLLTL